MIQCIRFNWCKHCLCFFMGGYNGINPDIVREGHGGSLNNLSISLSKNYLKIKYQKCFSLSINAFQV
ncbi:hypothetical protein DR91_2064 [Neisseria lactamica ATCC 23970]|nr:hypothetical protein DR91_2064 [Neisseria lactamica ATCC 23970]